MLKTVSSVFVGLSLVVFLVGCQTKSEPSPKADAAPPAVSESHAGHDHGEAEFHSHTVGPKGGVLAVLGQHQFHAEFLPDEATGNVIAYVYNDHFKPTKIEAKELSLDIMVDGAPKKFSLLVETDGADGKAATFKITDNKLAELIHDGWEGTAKVSLTVKDAPTSGSLALPEKKGDHQH